MTRLKLISLLSFNAIAAALVVALVTVLLTSKEKDELTPLQAACLQDSSPPAASRQLTSDGNFDSVDEAEAFICHEIAYPRDPQGWVYEDISAVRRASPRWIARGYGFASITLNYTLGRANPADLRIEVSPFEIAPVTYGIVDRILIRDAHADLIYGKEPGHVILQWRNDGYSFYTEAKLTPEFTLDDLMAVLNSIE